MNRIRTGAYRPKPSRIVEIPKSDGTTRPLAISCIEDKIVQLAVRNILERIYEPIFLNCSHGFRGGKGCQTALVDLNHNLISPECGAVVEIDLRKFFNTIPHVHLLRLLRIKIKDERLLRLVIKLLKAPTIGPDGKVCENEVGSPQGSILSPLLANIFLHYVVDIWFVWMRDKSPHWKGRMVRYADDVVFTFGSIGTGNQFLRLLRGRLASFGISINESKTRVLANGKLPAHIASGKGKKLETFTFLGFQHVWCKSVSSKTGKTFWRVKLFTCPNRFKKKLAEISLYIKKNRHQRGLVPKVVQIANGYLGYFAINDNLKRIAQFLHRVRWILHKFLNRRSQRLSFDKDKLERLLKFHRYPRPIIRHKLFFNRKFA
ncbi:MAG TPA: reverse transcriptase domain-containing protein [Bacteriovoracaceae bacterium]|nr:reverse transcriptase domain-containing protein [Bacteriovoracaceae bacterium]